MIELDLVLVVGRRAYELRPAERPLDPRTQVSKHLRVRFEDEEHWRRAGVLAELGTIARGGVYVSGEAAMRIATVATGAALVCARCRTLARHPGYQGAFCSPECGQATAMLEAVDGAPRTVPNRQGWNKVR